MNRHTRVHPIERHHIMIDVSPNLALSLLHEMGSYHEYREIALMQYIPSNSLLSDGQQVCIPLNKWFDSEADDGELTIDLGYKARYCYGLPEAHLLRQALLLALNYAQEVK
jgi:hypothetical protein